MVLSSYEVAPLLAARRAGAARVESSPDLGRSRVEVGLEEEGARFPDGALVRWELLEEIAASPQQCFRIEEGEAREIRVFSEETQWVRTLWPTGGPPTTVVAGFPMHRIKGIDPGEDTRRKLEPLQPLVGEVLDTATGLGYTAIGAARAGARVVTIELDPAALEIARQNPWSRELFEDTRITRLTGDAVELVASFASGRFSRIVHDPPTLRLGGELYSSAFYGELLRVLGRGGRLFHYIGDIEGGGGQRTAKGVIRRLREVGFARVVPLPKAFGVLAYK